jgi:hypothetical protein
VAVRRTLLLTLALLLVAAGCGGDDDGGDGTTTSAAPATSGAPAASTSVPATDVDALVFFSREGKVAAAGRAVEPPAVARGAMEALLAGPNDVEAGIGMEATLGEHTQLLGIEIADGVATVDLSGDFVNDTGADIALRVAQVVFTLTQFPTVDRVTLTIEGFTAPTVGFDAIPVIEVDRSDFEDQTPAILVESPTPGATVTSPVTVTGISNTFEANVRYDVTDAGGAVVDDGFTTATAGTGTWGEFSFTIAPDPGDVTLTVFQESAEDGRRVDEYVVPLHVG